MKPRTDTLLAWVDGEWKNGLFKMDKKVYGLLPEWLYRLKGLGTACAWGNTAVE